jgi:hypothetical protein
MDGRSLTGQGGCPFPFVQVQRLWYKITMIMGTLWTQNGQLPKVIWVTLGRHCAARDELSRDSVDFGRLWESLFEAPDTLWGPTPPYI